MSAPSSFVAFTMAFLTIAVMRSTGDDGGLNDYHRTDCSRCTVSGRLDIEHLFQVDERLYVQIKSNAGVYQVVHLNQRETPRQQLAIGVKDLFQNDFTKVISVLDFGPMYCEGDHCESDQVRLLRNRTIVLGYTREKKLTYQVYDKLYYTNGSLRMRPLGLQTSETIWKVSQLADFLVTEDLQSATYLRPYGLIVASFKDNTTFLQLLHKPKYYFKLQPLQISAFLPGDLSACGSFYWNDRLFVLNKAGVISTVDGESLLRQLTFIVPQKATTPFPRYSAEQFFKCNCSDSIDAGKRDRIHLSGINDLFLLYTQMVGQKESKEASGNLIYSKVLEELMHNMKVSIYKSLYNELLPPNGSVSSHLRMRHLRSCMNAMLANESHSGGDHYNGLALSFNHHLRSDTDFQLLPEIGLRSAEAHPTTDNHSKLLNITSLCIEATSSKLESGWYILLLALYFILGCPVFCVILCCTGGEEDADLLVIHGLGRELERKVCQHAVRYEDFVYLVEPYNDKTWPLSGARSSIGDRPNSLASLKSNPSRVSVSTTSSKPDTPQNVKPGPVKSSKVAIDMSTNERPSKSLRTKAAIPHEPMMIPARSNSPLDIRTSVNQSESLLRELTQAGGGKVSPPMLTKLKLKDQVASIKSKMGTQRIKANKSFKESMKRCTKSQSKLLSVKSTKSSGKRTKTTKTKVQETKKSGKC